MNVLADRHHADLLHALQLLFEDRLGMDLYVPVGRAWWDEEYWQFGKSLGDDRLARQYLDTNAAWRDLGNGRYVTYDPAHPDRHILGITRERAGRVGGWKFVVPTVQENQKGFQRFADEVGATYLYQVGNTGQQINWNLDPLVLNTSETPMEPGKGVTIHQELAACYQYAEPPQERRVVRNAVNAFNRLPGYAAFLLAENKLPDWEFTVHGHEGRDGDVNPASALYDLMVSAGFGWHDKPVGDGFGHVIHAWAAVGRPLVGHASYYHGKLAGCFWRHGETAWDLGQGSPVPFLRDTAADAAAHAQMCAAIRAEFDQRVDYDREADAVRALLGLSA